MDPDETATFDVFTKDNRTVGLESLIVELGDIKNRRIRWREKREIRPIWYILPWGVLTATVAAVVVAGIAVSVQKFIGGGIRGSLIGMLGAVIGISVVLAAFSKRLR